MSPKSLAPALLLLVGLARAGEPTPANAGAAVKPPSTQLTGIAADIDRALSALPPALRADAAVVDVDGHGKETALRPGTNGWTCLPRDPGMPQPRPMCLDRAGMAWLQAAMAGKAPDAGLVGYVYMLQGGTAISLVDPEASPLKPGEKPIEMPPHVMILSARLALESGFPGTLDRIDVRKPFVMYAGSPWAFIVLPLQ